MNCYQTWHNRFHVNWCICTTINNSFLSYQQDPFILYRQRGATSPDTKLQRIYMHYMIDMHYAPPYIDDVLCKTVKERESCNLKYFFALWVIPHTFRKFFFYQTWTVDLTLSTFRSCRYMYFILWAYFFKRLKAFFNLIWSPK